MWRQPLWRRAAADPVTANAWLPTIGRSSRHGPALVGCGLSGCAGPRPQYHYPQQRLPVTRYNAIKDAVGVVFALRIITEMDYVVGCCAFAICSRSKMSYIISSQPQTVAQCTHITESSC